MTKPVHLPLQGLCVSVALLTSQPAADSQSPTERPRAREAGVIVGSLPTGPLNAITDVAGVRVGHTTVVEDDAVHTGVTAILPHGGNVFLERVPAAIYVGNGFGKLIGVTQVRELGELETPILLTGTLSVWKAADAMVSWLLAQPGMEEVRSINPSSAKPSQDSSSTSDRADRPSMSPERWRKAVGGMKKKATDGAGAGRWYLMEGGHRPARRKQPISPHHVVAACAEHFGGDLTSTATCGTRTGAVQRTWRKHRHGSIKTSWRPTRRSAPPPRTVAARSMSGWRAPARTCPTVRAITRLLSQPRQSVAASAVAVHHVTELANDS